MCYRKYHTILSFVFFFSRILKHPECSTFSSSTSYTFLWSQKDFNWLGLAVNHFNLIWFLGCWTIRQVHLDTVSMGFILLLSGVIGVRLCHAINSEIWTWLLVCGYSFIWLFVSFFYPKQLTVELSRCWGKALLNGPLAAWHCRHFWSFHQ